MQPADDETVRETNLRVALYNAACRYAELMNGPNSGNCDEAMRVSDALEEAADNWAER